LGKLGLLRKSGENLKARSFRLFCEKFQPKTAIRSSLANFRKEDSLTNVPLYLAESFFNTTEGNIYE